jgi:N-acetylmuramoyl-L-alanine amidase
LKAGVFAQARNRQNKLLVAALLAFSGLFVQGDGNLALARKHTAVSHGSTSSSAGQSTGHSSGRHKHIVTQFFGSHKRLATVSGSASAHHGRHHKRHEAVVAHASKHAYPLELFMLKPPDFEHSALPAETASQIQRAFSEGYADSYDARSLVRAGLVSYHPLHGGIYWRREPVKYIILHSTETGIPVSATRVIEGWGSMGRRHPGAQYVVDRDGTIFQAVDPDLATVHVNIFKTLPGINNDNSIGIEMNHTGRQDYPDAERQAVLRLVTYLQNRYNVGDEHIVTHRYAQQGDHTDPVNFDFEGFLSEKNHFRNRAIAYKVNKINAEAATLPAMDPVTASTSTYLQPHGPITTTSVKAQAAPRTDTTPGATADDGRQSGDNKIDSSLNSMPSPRPASAAVAPLPRAGTRGGSGTLRPPIEMDPDDLNDLKKQPANTAPPSIAPPNTAPTNSVPTSTAPGKSDEPGPNATVPGSDDESSPDGLKFFVH